MTDGNKVPIYFTEHDCKSKEFKWTGQHPWNLTDYIQNSLANFPTKVYGTMFSFVTHFKTLTFVSNFSSLKTILSQSSDCTLLETSTVML